MSPASVPRAPAAIGVTAVTAAPSGASAPPRSRLLPITLCVILLAEGAVWLVDNAADVDVHPSVYPGARWACGLGTASSGRGTATRAC